MISPLLMNVYLHYVLDDWIETEVKPRLKGRAFLIRYADDLVIGFTDESDAQRVMEVLPKRFGRYGLKLHPDKTGLIPFHSPSRTGQGGGQPGSFDLLGFTHYWARSRKGNWVVQRKTASSRLSRAMRSIAQWCRKCRHWPIAEQQQALNQKIRGHCAYYGITGNSRALSDYRLAVVRCWRKWLSRRNRERSMTWDVFARLLERYPLLPARAVHSTYAGPAKG